MIKLGSNIESLKAQQKLADSSQELSQVYERLSSGQRINRASDDAAGLAISESLKANSRIYNQAIRNINDGVSVLNIADGALSQLVAIVTRQKELAEQSANGTYSVVQRRSLHREANALVDEFNRIVASTTFNGQKIFDTSRGDIRLQAGFGINGSLAIDVTNGLARNVGNGTFDSGVTISGYTAVAGAVISADIDGDGNLDYVKSNYTFGGTDPVTVAFGNGDGTFAQVSVGGIINTSGMTVGDYNGDGKLDFATTQGNNSVTWVFMNQGNRTFSATSIVAGGSSSSINTGDFNGDGKDDLIVNNTLYTNSGNVLLSNGDGTFRVGFTFSSPYGVNHQTGAVGDINNDGKLDFVEGTTGGARVMLGNGDGTFSEAPTISIGWGGRFGSAILQDFNRDGLLDIMLNDSTTDIFNVALGRGDGTFATAKSFPGKTSGTSSNLTVGDFNGDGYLDVFQPNSSGYSISLGNGDGTFALGTSSSEVGVSSAVGDFNKDGVQDLLLKASGNVKLLQGKYTRETTQSYLYLLSANGARQELSNLDTVLNRISSQTGQIGAFQSRLGTALRTLESTRENIEAANSRIRDADIAKDSSELLRLKILQQSAAAVLAQTNLNPALALQLLS